MDEELGNKLKPQGVVKFEKVNRRKDGQLISADSYILPVQTPKNFCDI